MKKNKLFFIFIGVFIGFVNGLFGSGGGILAVIALIFLIKLNDYKAHATAISIILPLSIISSFIYILNHTVDLKTSIPVIMGGLFGSFIGAKNLEKIPVHMLRKIFGTVIIYSAIRMIWI